MIPAPRGTTDGPALLLTTRDGQPRAWLLSTTGALHPLTGPADTREALTLTLARNGWAPSAPGPLAEDPHRTPLAPIPATAMACPRWCTDCTTGDALRWDAEHGRAVLWHRRPVPTGEIPARVAIALPVLLTDRPRVGAAVVELAIPHPLHLTGADAAALGLALIMTAALLDASEPGGVSL